MIDLARYVNAVLREITSMWLIRDRSVVRSSVIPSAKYCCSGSLLRLANGSTTIDRRGATKGCGIGVAVAALTAGAVEVVVGAGQTHQVITAMASTVATVAAIGGTMLRRRRGAKFGTLAAGRSPWAS